MVNTNIVKGVAGLALLLCGTGAGAADPGLAGIVGKTCEGNKLGVAVSLEPGAPMQDYSLRVDIAETRVGREVFIDLGQTLQAELQRDNPLHRPRGAAKVCRKGESCVPIDVKIRFDELKAGAGARGVLLIAGKSGFTPFVAQWTGTVKDCLGAVAGL